MNRALGIRVLGDFTVTSGDQAVPLPQSRKTRALLAYLAVTAKPQRREHLCELFWDVPDDPRGSLRWSLSKLRQILEADGIVRLAADRNFVQLKAPDVELDYDLVRGLAPDMVPGLPTDRLEAAAAAFTGPFLADLDLPRCPPFEAWRTYCAGDAEVLRLKILRTLVDRLGDEPARALPHVHALQSLLPEEDLGIEIASISGRARLTAAASPRRGTLPARPSPPSAGLASGAAAAVGAAVLPDEPPLVAGQRVSHAVSRDGTRIAYAISGSGPAIVRASHWMSHLEFDWESPVWGPWIESLSDGFTLVRYDSRLNGLSDKEAEDLSLDAFVADLECVVEAVGLERFALLGISQGCTFSVEYAVRHPEKVAGLMLYGGYVRGWRARGNPAEIARREAIATLMREGWGQDDPVFRQVFTNLFIPGASRVQMDWFNELQRRTLTPENALRLSGAFGKVDVADRLGRIRTPAVVWHARADRVAPLQEGRELAAGIPGARFSELDSQNHILLGDEPAFQDFVREAKSFAHEVLQSSASLAVDRRTRRPATILCAIFTSPGDSLDEEFPEAALELVDPAMMRAADIVRDNGGTVLDIADMELLACFGAPDALEGHAALACRAGLSIREAVGNGSAVRVRVALDTGIVVVGPPRPGHRGELEVRGPPVTLAGSIGHGLGSNLLVATERTSRAAGGFVEMERLSPRRMPGVPADLGLLAVNGFNQGRSRWHLRADRQLSRFIGRDVQLQMLNRAWRDARDGDGQSLFVVADPGLGKSRLTHEFVGAIPDNEAECLEAGALETDLKAGLAVIRRLLQGLFEIDGTEAPAAAVEKVARAQGARGFDQRLVDPVLAAMDLPPVDPLWGAMSAAERSRRLREAVVALLLSLAAAKPVVLLVEDLHWLDAESEAILARLGEALQAGRILMILTCRPEYGRGAFSGARSSEIRLSAFSTVETDELLDHLLGTDPMLGPVRERLSEACRGNALFLEETVRLLADTGRLTGSPGRYRAAGDPGEIEATANINAIVAARLERLDAHARRLAEVASIFGGEIPADLLKRLAALPGEEFDEALQGLKRADLLVEVQVFPESLLRYKHALIRRSISGRIVTAARVELHRRALAGLESYYSDRLEEHVEQLARHAIEGQLWQAAVGHLLASAWKAIQRSAHSGALAQLDSGIGLLQAHPEIENADHREIEFQLARGVALMAARGWGSAEVLEAFERAEVLCGTTGDDTRLFSTLRGRAQYYMISGQPAAAQELAERCARLVEGTADPGLLIETDHMFWTNNFFLGDARAARTHAERTIGCYDAERDHRLTHLYSGHDPGVCSRCFAGLAAWLGGEPDAATHHCAAAVELAERLGHPLSTALAYWGQSHLHLLAGQPEQSLHWAEREIFLAEQFQFPLFVGQALCQSGWARFWMGRHDAGLAEMEEGMDRIRATGAEMGLPYFIALHAEALCAAGRIEEARNAVTAAIRLGQQNGTLMQFAEVLGVEARIDERLGAAPGEVEKKLRQARALAQSQHSAMGELRLATELAGRLRRQDRLLEAKALVSAHAGLIARLAGFRDGEAARDYL